LLPALATLWARPLAAEEASIPITIAYADPAGCAPEHGFWRQLSRRSERVRVATSSDATALEVAVERSGAARRGILTIREAGDVVTVREISGASCDEVITAMALVAAIFLDPNARTEPLAEEASPPPPEPKRPRAPERPLYFGLGVRLAVDTAFAPDPVLGGVLALEGALERGSILSPLFVLSGTRTATATARAAGGVAELQYTGARAMICPLRLPAKGGIRVRPCAAFDAGSFTATGVATLDPDHSSDLWLAVGGLARLDANLFGPLAATLELGAAFPLFRYGYYFDPLRPESRAFYVPLVGVSGRAGVTAVF
jgi:hypothetical protein